ncbi:hypothetical protein NDU88_002130 [Pleurodeles waltl]|uniref:Uncharacterized protein n=1 Tax=Pleurodeles waltl TaxID=8319 RepID=A0AAV7T1Z4_PLEWA|nr:hypothetical protein NDU88_002130 [Pleurodeles waltl]
MANPALPLQEHIPGSREDADFYWTPPGPSRVVVPPGAARGDPRLSRSKQHVTSASPGVAHRCPSLLPSAQRCSRFVTPVRPSSGSHTYRVPVAWVRLCSFSFQSGCLNGQPGSESSGSHPWPPGGC